MSRQGKKMFFGVSRQRMLSTVFIISFIYVACFLLMFYNFEIPFIDNSSEFLKSFAAASLGGGAIAMITAILMIFQDHIQSKQGKKKEIFDKKIVLYMKIIEDMNEYFRPKENEKDTPKMDDDEKRELFFTQMKVLLLANPEASILYSDMIKKLTDDNNLITEDSYLKFMNFIFEAREDLEVQEKMSKEQREQFDVMKKNIEEEAKKVASISGGRTFFADFDSWFTEMKNGQKADPDADPPVKERKPQNISNEMKDKTKIIHDSIIDLLANHGHSIESIPNDLKNKKDKPDRKIYTPTGGCALSVFNKKIVNMTPKKSYLELLTLRDCKNSYYRPLIEGLEIENCRKYNSTGANNWGYDMYIIKIEYNQLDKYLPAILQLIEASYQTLKDDKVLKVPAKDWEAAWNDWLEEVFDKTYSL